MKEYEEMKISDSTILDILKDMPKITPQATVRSPHKHWWWPFRSRQQRAMDKFMESLVNSDKTINEVMRKTNNVLLYGTEEPPKDK